MSDPIRAFSFGCGVQSVAALALAAAGRIDFRTFLFANVGEDSEYPGTLDYFRRYALPFAKANDIELRELHRIRRDGSTETLYGRLSKEGSLSLPIPVRMSNGAPGTRSCTVDFKIKVIGKELKRRGATADNPAVVGIGISLDEVQRANASRAKPYEQIVYPLLDLRLRRIDCFDVIRGAGLPIPPPSECWFCPFHRPEKWGDLRRNEPELFAKACDLERQLNNRRASLGKDPVWLTRFAKPLDVAIPDGQDTLPFDEWDETALCDSGRCFT